MSEQQIEVRTAIPMAPTADYVVLQHVDQSPENPLGLHLDQAVSLTADEQPIGFIMAVGPDVPEYIEPGALVLARKYTGTDIVVDGRIYHQYRWADILGIALDPAAFGLQEEEESD